MNDNVKNFLEAVSKDDSLFDKIQNSSHEDLLALAAELNLPLSKEDIDSYKVDVKDVSAEELEAVSGGSSCTCVIGGSGKATKEGQRKCICALGGYGETDIITGVHCRCYCVYGGHGKDQSYTDY